MMRHEQIRCVVKDLLKEYEGTQLDAAAVNVISEAVAGKLAGEPIQPPSVNVDVSGIAVEAVWDLNPDNDDEGVIYRVSPEAMEEARHQALLKHDPGAALRAKQTAAHPERIVVEIGDATYWALRQWNNKYHMDEAPHPEVGVRGFPKRWWVNDNEWPLHVDVIFGDKEYPADLEESGQYKVPDAALKSYVLECKCGEQHPIAVVQTRRRDFADFAEPFCAGWNRCRTNGPDISPDAFQKVLMEAYENSGSERARRLSVALERAQAIDAGTKPYHWGSEQR
jgi:hypothetical protein